MRNARIRWIMASSGKTRVASVYQLPAVWIPNSACGSGGRFETFPTDRLAIDDVKNASFLVLQIDVGDDGVREADDN